MSENQGVVATLKRKIAESPIADIAVELSVAISVLGVTGLAFKVATWVLEMIMDL